MIRTLVLSVALVTAACSKSSITSDTGSGSGNVAAKPDVALAPPKPTGPDGLPSGYVVPKAGKLAAKQPPKWRYNFGDARVDDVAKDVETGLTAAGWTVVVREINAQLPVILANHNGDSVVAIIDHDFDTGTFATFEVKPDMLLTPPAGYPAGFAFVPFAQLYNENRDDRIALIYIGKQYTIDMPLAKAERGWDCTGDMTKLQVCRKDAVEVTVSLNKLSNEKVVVFVSKAEARRGGGP
jgi:hypothetical protein